MVNRAPIFLNCFSRGGSNIFWNVFLSHPDVCSPISETLQIFGAGLTHATWEGYLVAAISGQPRLFDQWNLAPRRPINRLAARIIDDSLYRRKLRTLHDEEMRFKYEDEPYALEEVQTARLTAKNNNGLVFLSQALAEIYPDAVFFGLVRDPFALYEGHRRHRIASSAEAFGQFYQTLVQRMIDDAERLPNYHLARFEDLLADPVTLTRTVYSQAGLDMGKLRKLRFKAKSHLQADGQRATSFKEGRHYWFEMDEVGQILDPNINEYQSTRLTPDERRAIVRAAGPTLERFGYSRD